MKIKFLIICLFLQGCTGSMKYLPSDPTYALDNLSNKKVYQIDGKDCRVSQSGSFIRIECDE